MLRDYIIKHLIIYKEFKNAGIPMGLLSNQDEDNALQVSRKINESNIEHLNQKLTDNAISYLFYDIDAIPYIKRLLEEGIACRRVNSLLVGAEEKLSEYKYEDVATVTKDNGVRDRALFRYMKYYLSYGLSDDLKEHLMDALDSLDMAGVPISELSKEQKCLLWEPVFSSAICDRVLNMPGFWEKLQNTEILKLLNALAGYIGNTKSLNRDLFNQMCEHPQEIESGLHEVLSQIDPEDIECFLTIWLENEALLYDFKMLRDVIPRKKKEEIKQLTRNRAGYIGAVYGDVLSGFDAEHVPEWQEKLLIYAITHKKKHFISLVKERSSDFCCLPHFSMLLDSDVYKKYLNINTLNDKDLVDCFQIRKMKSEVKEQMVKDSYSFAELKVLAPLNSTYVLVYHKLLLERSDDRLRIFREIVKKKCLPNSLEETEAVQLGRLLSQRPLSKWMQEVLSHVYGLRPHIAILLLCYWDELQRFVIDIENDHQAEFLIKNRGALTEMRNFDEVKETMPKIDCTWKLLKEFLYIEDTFEQENYSAICEFLQQGGGQIMYKFCKDQWRKKEETKRLLMADILGRFHEIKYYGNDLEREIAYPITEEVKQLWMENRLIMEKDMELREEDRLLPVMQIGEILGHTCLSYINGDYKECLLSSFDANKKILFLSIGGTIVFRAIIRLTKGSFSKIKQNKNLEFIDVTTVEQDTSSECKEKPEEYLTLFLERPYFKGVTGKREKEIVNLVIILLKQKAEEMRARLVLSDNYQKFDLEDQKFVRVQYFMYISESKNGSQYCDSLGGEANVQRSGSYNRGYFLMQEI